MDEKKDWLEKVLDDASAEVESWPNWLKDRQIEKQENEPRVRRAAASAGTNHQNGKNPSS
jgi:hypothetical protein